MLISTSTLRALYVATAVFAALTARGEATDSQSPSSKITSMKNGNNKKDTNISESTKDTSQDKRNIVLNYFDVEHKFPDHKKPKKTPIASTPTLPGPDIPEMPKTMEKTYRALLYALPYGPEYTQPLSLHLASQNGYRPPTKAQILEKGIPRQKPVEEMTYEEKEGLLCGNLWALEKKHGEKTFVPAQHIIFTLCKWALPDSTESRDGKSSLISNDDMHRYYAIKTRVETLIVEELAARTGAPNGVLDRGKGRGIKDPKTKKKMFRLYEDEYQALLGGLFRPDVWSEHRDWFTGKNQEKDWAHRFQKYKEAIQDRAFEALQPRQMKKEKTPDNEMDRIIIRSVYVQLLPLLTGLKSKEAKLIREELKLYENLFSKILKGEGGKESSPNTGPFLPHLADHLLVLAMRSHRFLHGKEMWVPAKSSKGETINLHNEVVEHEQDGVVQTRDEVELMSHVLQLALKGDIPTMRKSPGNSETIPERWEAPLSEREEEIKNKVQESKNPVKVFLRDFSESVAGILEIGAKGNEEQMWNKVKEQCANLRAAGPHLDARLKTIATTSEREMTVLGLMRGYCNGEEVLPRKAAMVKVEGKWVEGEAAGDPRQKKEKPMTLRRVIRRTVEAISKLRIIKLFPKVLEKPWTKVGKLSIPEVWENRTMDITQDCLAMLWMLQKTGTAKALKRTKPVKREQKLKMVGQLIGVLGSISTVWIRKTYTSENEEFAALKVFTSREDRVQQEHGVRSRVQMGIREGAVRLRGLFKLRGSKVEAEAERVVKWLQWTEGRDRQMAHRFLWAYSVMQAYARYKEEQTTE